MAIESKLEKSEPKKESKERAGPEIHYHFFYSPHGTAKDVENLEKAFKGADVYVPEIYGWSEEHKNEYKDLSEGKITPEELLLEKYDIGKRTSRIKEWEIIYNSKKAILLVDISSQDKNFLEQRQEFSLLLSRANELFISGYFKESLGKYRSFLEGYGKLQLERERKIKENLDKQINKLLKTSPEYSKKEKLKVLIRLGIPHTKIYQDFKKEEMSVSKEFSQMPFVYNYFFEAIRNSIFNRESSDETIARAIIDEAIASYLGLNNLTNDSAKLMKITRHLSSFLTIKDIKKISENLGQSLQPDQDAVIKEIEKSGVKLPKSEKEIDEMLEK